MTYIVENNGVYGLTKGQFSATADRGSKSKRGVTNTDNAIDLVAIALQLGASFVARSFSGDKTQLVPLIEAAIRHQGAAFIDVISPCVAFNNHAGSTKSFDYVREHNEAVNRLDVITGREPITVDYAPGSVQVVEQHDGTRLALRKLDADYDVHDRLAAMAFLQKHAAKGQVVTGLLYVDPDVGRPARPPQHGGRAAQRARGEGPLPRHRGAGKDQRQLAVALQPGLSATACLTAAMNSGGGPSFPVTRGLPVSRRLLRPERIFGQPISPPLRMSRGTSHEWDSVIVRRTVSPDGAIS